MSSLLCVKLQTVTDILAWIQWILWNTVKSIYRGLLGHIVGWINGKYVGLMEINMRVIQEIKTDKTYQRTLNNVIETVLS